MPLGHRLYRPLLKRKLLGPLQGLAPRPARCTPGRRHHHLLLWRPLQPPKPGNSRGQQSRCACAGDVALRGGSKGEGKGGKPRRGGGSPGPRKPRPVRGTASLRRGTPPAPSLRVSLLLASKHPRGRSRALPAGAVADSLGVWACRVLNFCRAGLTASYQS